MSEAKFEITSEILNSNFVKFIEEPIHIEHLKNQKILEQIIQEDEQISSLSSQYNSDIQKSIQVSSLSSQNSSDIEQIYQVSQLQVKRQNESFQQQLKHYIQSVVEKITKFHQPPQFANFELPLNQINFNKKVYEEEQSNNSSPYKSTCTFSTQNSSQRNTPQRQNRTDFEFQYFEVNQSYEFQQPKLCLIRASTQRWKDMFQQQQQQQSEEKEQEYIQYPQQYRIPMKAKLAKLKRKSKVIEIQSSSSGNQDESTNNGPVRFINNICSFCSKNYGSRCWNVQRGHLKRCTEKYWMRYFPQLIEAKIKKVTEASKEVVI